MAQEKFTDLPTLTTAASDDVLPVVDTSANVSKQMPVSGLGPAVAPYLGDISWWQLTGWTQSSYDSTNKTGVITVPSTDTSDIGQKVKFTQGGSTKFGIITAKTSTTRTIYFGTDYSLDGTAITNPYCSPFRAPSGFPMDPNKWTYTFQDPGDYTNTSGDHNWHNPGTLAVTFPIGCWRVFYEIVGQVGNGSATAISFDISLSTSTTSESDSDLTAFSQGQSLTLLRSTVRREKTLTFTTPTTYNIIISTPNASNSLGFMGTSGKPTTVKAICAYL